jgi:hypothetical protein
VIVQKWMYASCFVVISGCASTQESAQAEEMYIQASALTKLSAAVESMVRYKNPSPSWTDEELLAASTEHDPRLLGSLAGYKLLVLNQDRHAIVLVCTPSGERSLLEDAGCTGQMDRHRWKAVSSCEFTLSPDNVCGKE